MFYLFKVHFATSKMVGSRQQQPATFRRQRFSYMPLFLDKCENDNHIEQLYNVKINIEMFINTLAILDLN